MVWAVLSCYVMSWSVTTLSLFQQRGFVAGANPSLFLDEGRAGYSLDKSPVHRRVLTEGVNYTSGAIWGSVSCSRLLTSARRIWTSHLPITSQPARPVERQPPRELFSTAEILLYAKSDTQWKHNQIILSLCRSFIISVHNTDNTLTKKWRIYYSLRWMAVNVQESADSFCLKRRRSC